MSPSMVFDLHSFLIIDLLAELKLDLLGVCPRLYVLLS